MSTAPPPPERAPERAPEGSAEAAPRRPHVGAVKALVGIAGTFGILGVLLTRVELEAVAGVFRSVRVGWLAFGLGLYVVLQGVRAVRFRRLAPEAPTRVLLGAHFVHALLLRVMPFRTGELGFAWLMRRHGAGGFARNLVGVLLLRVLDLTTVLVVFAVGLVAASARGAAGSYGGAVAIPAVAALIALLAPLYLQRLVHLVHRLLSATLRGLALTRFASVRRADASLTEAVRWSARLPRSTLWWLSGLTTVQWAVNFLLIGVLMVTMGVDVTVTQTVLGGTGSVLGGLLPLAGIGNFGPLEAGWSAGFAAAGVSRDLAIASAFGFSVISFGYAILTGAAGWALLLAARRRD